MKRAFLWVVGACLLCSASAWAGEPQAITGGTETADSLLDASLADNARSAAAVLDKKSTAAIAKDLHSDDRRKRCDAALALAKRGDKRGLPILIQELEDKTPRPADLQEGSKSVVARMGTMRSDRYYAALLLGQLRDKASVPPLTEALRDDTINARAALSLAEIGDKGAIPALRRMAKDFPGKRRSAGYALATLGESEGFSMLTEVVWHGPNPAERELAAKAIGSIDRRAGTVADELAALVSEDADLAARLAGVDREAPSAYDIRGKRDSVRKKLFLVHDVLRLRGQVLEYEKAAGSYQDRPIVQRLEKKVHEEFDKCEKLYRAAAEKCVGTLEPDYQAIEALKTQAQDVWTGIDGLGRLPEDVGHNADYAAVWAPHCENTTELDDEIKKVDARVRERTEQGRAFEQHCLLLESLRRSVVAEAEKSKQVLSKGSRADAARQIARFVEAEHALFDACDMFRCLDDEKAKALRESEANPRLQEAVVELAGHILLYLGALSRNATIASVARPAEEDEACIDVLAKEAMAIAHCRSNIWEAADKHHGKR